MDKTPAGNPSIEELAETMDYSAEADIKFRMLQPHELAAAMSFPKDYYFRGTGRNSAMP